MIVPAPESQRQAVIAPTPVVPFSAGETSSPYNPSPSAVSALASAASAIAAAAAAMNPTPPPSSPRAFTPTQFGDVAVLVSPSQDDSSREGSPVVSAATAFESSNIIPRRLVPPSRKLMENRVSYQELLDDPQQYSALPTVSMLTLKRKRAIPPASPQQQRVQQQLQLQLQLQQQYFLQQQQRVQQQQQQQQLQQQQKSDKFSAAPISPLARAQSPQQLKEPQVLASTPAPSASAAFARGASFSTYEHPPAVDLSPAPPPLSSSPLPVPPPPPALCMLPKGAASPLIPLGSRIKALQSALASRSKERLMQANYARDDTLAPPREADAPTPRMPMIRPLAGPSLSRADVALRLGLTSDLSLHDMLATQLPLRGSKPLYTVLDDNGKPARTISHKALWARVQEVGEGLLYNLRHDLAAAHGDPPRIALVFSEDDASSILHFAEALLGCLSHGLIPVIFPLSARHSEVDVERLTFLLGACDCKAAVTDKQSRKLLSALIEDQTGQLLQPGYRVWLQESRPFYMLSALKHHSSVKITGGDTPYIEMYANEASVHGLVVLQSSVLQQCCAMEAAHKLTAGDSSLIALSPFAGPGLFHGIRL